MFYTEVYHEEGQEEFRKALNSPKTYLIMVDKENTR